MALVVTHPKAAPALLTIVAVFVLVSFAGRLRAEGNDAGPATRPAAEPATHPSTAPAVPGAVRKIGVDEFDRLRTKPDTVVLDVRTPEEFAAGHVPGAVNLPVQSPDFDKKAEALDKDKTYLVHCARGGRAAAACGKMTHMDFKSLIDFPGGMEAWKKAGKPIEKGE